MKRILVYASAAHGMTSQQQRPLHVNLPAHLRLTERIQLTCVSLPSTPCSLSLLPFPPTVARLRRLYKIVKIEMVSKKKGRRMRVNLPDL